MTENYPPPPGGEQPAQPQYPAQPPQGQPAPPPHYGQQPPQGYYPPQQGGYPPQYQQPQPGYAQYPQPVMFVPAPKPPKPASWGLRIAAGILGIISGLWSMLDGIIPFARASGSPDALNGFVGLLLIIAGLANLVAGIMVLATSRSRTQGAAITLLAAAAASLMAHSIGSSVLPPMFIMPTFAALIVTGLATGKDNAATASAPDRLRKLRTSTGIVTIVLSTFLFSAFAFSVRMAEHQLDFTLPLQMLAGPAALAAGLVLLAGIPKFLAAAPAVSLSAASLGFLMTLVNMFRYTPDVISLLVNAAVIVLSIILLVKTKGTKPKQWFTPPPYDQAPVRTGE